jgi:hypothetical protein
VTPVREGRKKNGVGDAVFRLLASAENLQVRMCVRDMAVFKDRGAVAAREIDRNNLSFKIMLTGEKLDPKGPARIKAVSSALRREFDWDVPDGWYEKPIKFLRRNQSIRYVIVGDRVICISGQKLRTSAILIRDQRAADWFTRVFETDWASPEASALSEVGDAATT